MSYETKYVLRANQGHAFFRDKKNCLRELYAKKIEVKMKTDVDKIIELGKNTYSHIPGAVEITGNMEVYYCSDYIFQQYLEYAQGKSYPPFFDLHIQNSSILNGNSYIGNRHVIVKGVFLSSILGGYVGQDTQIITDSMDFTAEGLELSEAFQELETNKREI